MIIVGSSNARVGLPLGMAVLRRGGSALDAVEAAIRAVESNPDDHTVGLGGLPNLLGVVELDASIMDGRTRAAGAVAAVRGFEHPISIARRVMEELPHAFLVGEGAERFARECGFPPAELLTPEAQAIYQRGIRGEGTGEVRYGEAILRAMASRLAMQPERASGRDAGTVNVIALDGEGHLASGVSTSGFAWKYPGRVGDSAVIGAGNYCDDRYGAAACTGRGEIAIRAATAHTVVEHLSRGDSPEEAGRKAMEALNELADPFFSAMNVVVLAPDGRHAAFSSLTAATYAVMDERSPEVREIPRTFVPVRADGAGRA
ncbi:MAG: isoaspartyl peptidase/L-asparaginase [Firmicutes bacterium]|nr:isoaspartyl peptidase/L-asparaginase [Bacillota bacterium]